MRPIIIFISLLCLIGCTYEGARMSDYIERPRDILRDPHFAQYQENRDTIEGQYLRKEITYAEYIDQLKKIDDKYAQEVEERTKIIDSTY